MPSMTSISDCLSFLLPLREKVAEGRMRGRAASKVLFLLAIFACCAPTLLFAEPVRLNSECRVRFATRLEGIAAITVADQFTVNFSKFDLQVRLKTDQPVTIDDWKKFVSGEVRNWEDADRTRLVRLFEKIRDQMAEFTIPLPDEFVLISTTGKEESGAAYCRGKAIILPANVLTRDDATLETLILHEMFHVISNVNPDLRKQLYGIVGFEECEEIPIHPTLKDRRISNPDAPTINCVIEITDAGRTYFAAPVLYSSQDRFDPNSRKVLFDYMLFRLMTVQKTKDGWRATDHDGRATVLDPKKSPAYLEKIGRNTNYIIHPEEILADNFTYLILKRGNLPSPRVVEELKKVLAGK